MLLYNYDTKIWKLQWISYFDVKQQYMHEFKTVEVELIYSLDLKLKAELISHVESFFSDLHLNMIDA